MKSAQYPALQSSSCIRVLQLKFHSNTTSPDAEFHVIDLDDGSHPEYYALSYACGNTEPVEYVRFPSIRSSPRIGIGKSLSDAFARLRYDEIALNRRVQLLWIDALCINQDDLVERAQQVKIMHRIFGSASLVLSWLGAEEDTHLEATDELLNKFSNPLKDDDFGAAAWVRNFSAAGHFNEGEKGLLQRRTIVQDLKSSTSEHEFELLQNFFNRAWFTRLWVVQEVVVAKTMIVLCGRKMIKQYDIVGMAACWYYAVLGSLGLRTRPDIRNAATTTWNMRQDYQTLKKKLALERRRPLGRLQFSEPRDEVFAIVGTLKIPPETSSLWEIDYSKAVWKVLADATRGLLLHEGLDSLIQACASDRPLYDNLPSWVPNRKYQGATWITSLYQRFSASGSRRTVIRPSEDERILSLSGTKSQEVMASMHFNTQEDLDAKDCISETCNKICAMYEALRSLLPMIKDVAGKDLTDDLDEIFTNMTSCGVDSFGQDLVNTGSHLLQDFREFAYTWARAVLAKQSASFSKTAATILAVMTDKVDVTALPENVDGFVFNRYVQAMWPTCRNGCMVYLGAPFRFGISSRHAEAGDILTVLEGAKYPTILRRSEPPEQESTNLGSVDSLVVAATRDAKDAAEQPSFRDEKAWKLVGPAYVEGMMDGEMFKDGGGGAPELQEYDII